MNITVERGQKEYLKQLISQFSSDVADYQKRKKIDKERKMKTKQTSNSFSFFLNVTQKKNSKYVLFTILFSYRLNIQ